MHEVEYDDKLWVVAVDISTRLGFGKTVPQDMLLDRGGTMAADTAESEDGDLRALLDGLLAARAEIDESP